ncbi:MAG TPA: pilus assembly protein TadG-related protein [Actinomycetota bacterium]|nr:pilus assembly protein TadG-related protein [Actinomycetota bacterium]
MSRTSRRTEDGERGATAVIVVISLFALLGLVVLTVDVGQLLFKRRAMVNASDAAALAAAQSCAGLGDADDPALMANIFAQQNVSVATGGITEMVGCDSAAFGHVTVEYGMDQSLFFAGVLGANGPARVSTTATAGWGPTGGGNPVPIVVYEGITQGGCNIVEEPALPAGTPCYLWYDNTLFGDSAFGFLNLCTENDACSKGWDVAPDTSCSADRRDVERWVEGTWLGGPNVTNYPDGPTYVCRVSGLASDIWHNDLEPRIGEELMFPVNDCTTQVDKDGNIVGCNAVPDKYNIVGFIVLKLTGILDDQADWGDPASRCQTAQADMNAASPSIDLDVAAASLGCTPYDFISNVQVTGINSCCVEGTHYSYDPTTHVVDWIGGNARNVRIDWDYGTHGPCGPPPGNSSAVCLQVETVSPRFRGNIVNSGGKDFGARSVRLCDLQIGSCPRDEG